MNGEKWVIVKKMYHYCLRCTLQLLLMNGETCERRAKRRAKRRVSGACAWLRGQAVFLGNTQSLTHAAHVARVRPLAVGPNCVTHGFIHTNSPIILV